MSYSMKILPVGAELFHEDGRTNMTKPIVAFRYCVNAPKTTHPSARVSLIPLYQQISWQFTLHTSQIVHSCLYRVNKSLCAPDDYSTKNTQKHFKQFQSLTMKT
jgi:hypothetical protein